MLELRFKDSRNLREKIVQANRKMRRIEKDFLDLTPLLQDILEHYQDNFVKCMAIGHEINLAREAIDRACKIAQKPEKKK